MKLLLAAKCLLVATALSFPMHFAKTEPISDYTIYTAKDLYCLTKNIYHEARGESQLGKIAVAQVTMNRVKHGTRWPGTICEVVYHKVNGVPQFSWTTEEHLKVTDSRAWAEAKHIAYKVISGEMFIKHFNFTFFHNTTVEHGQLRKNHRIIGNHVFYQ